MHRFTKSPNQYRRKEARGGPNAPSAASSWNPGRIPSSEPIGWSCRWNKNISPSRRRPLRPDHLRRHRHQLSPDSTAAAASGATPTSGKTPTSAKCDGQTFVSLLKTERPPRGGLSEISALAVFRFLDLRKACLAQLDVTPPCETSACGGQNPLPPCKCFLLSRWQCCAPI